MRRREFISAAAGAAFLNASEPSGIIDTHTHFYDPQRAQGVPWPPRSDRLLYRRVMPEGFVALASPLGVTATIVVEASPWLEDNQWILDLARDNPVIAGFIGHIEPGAAGFPGQLARFAKNPLFRGIRVGPSALQYTDDFRRLAGLGLALDVLGPDSMLDSVVRLAEAVPDLRIVVNHLPFDSGRIRACPPNVFAKVSGRFTPDGLEAVWAAFGPDRVLYGSNWPVSERQGSYSDRLRFVREFFTAKGVAGKYFYSNSKDAYRWLDRRA